MSKCLQHNRSKADNKITRLSARVMPLWSVTSRADGVIVLEVHGLMLTVQVPLQLVHFGQSKCHLF
jgi:hypothetical protein